MAVERLKFRCYQCNQLLASSPGKAGSVVSCPRCKADLVVPAQESRPPGDLESSSVGMTLGRVASTLAQPKPGGPADFDESSAAIPADLIDLRPEDLRVEAEFFKSLTRAPDPPKEAEPAPSAAREAAAAYPSVDTGFPAISPFSSPAIEPEPAFRPAAPGPEPPRGFPSAPPISPLLAPASPDVPPIEIEPPSLRPSNKEFHPVREVVLPASAVLAWSLFGLIGIATSFIAGLMIGHYFWRM